MSSKYDTRYRPSDNGFSLVEVMVALIVMSVGLLGIAKMQALALSNTTTSRMRSLVALEAASLASTMRADRNYWSAVTADPQVVIGGGVVSSTQDPNLQAAAPCPSCTPAQIAMNDLAEWASELNSVAPGASATVGCTVAAATPISCQISVSWVEHVIASNTQQAQTQQAAQQAGTPPPATNYILYVDP